MGIHEALTGLKKVLAYEIVLGTGHEIGVRVRKFVPEVPGPDFVRLWACYQAKIVYNLGYPDNLSAMMALGSVAKIVEKDLRADLADVARFAAEPPATGTVFHGEFDRTAGSRSLAAAGQRERRRCEQSAWHPEAKGWYHRGWRFSYDEGVEEGV